MLGTRFDFVSYRRISSIEVIRFFPWEGFRRVKIVCLLWMCFFQWSLYECNLCLRDRKVLKSKKHVIDQKNQHTSPPSNHLRSVVKQTHATRITPKISLELEHLKHLHTQRWSNKNPMHKWLEQVSKKILSRKVSKHSAINQAISTMGSYKHKFSQIMQQENQPSPNSKLSRIVQKWKQNKHNLLQKSFSISQRV